MTNIVKNSTQGYGYNYASLSDIANQGFELPKMKTGTDPISLRDYVYYYDKDLNEWIRGCEIIVPDIKGMNKCQQYLSSITYARRGTTQMALSLACQDDQAIENTNADGTSKEPAKATQKQIEYIVKLYNAPMVAKILQHYQIESLNELSIQQATEVIDQAKKRNEEIRNEKLNQ